MRLIVLRILTSALVFAATWLAASPITADAQTIAITGGTVYPVSGPAIPNGTVLIRDGKIAEVGASVAIPSDAQRIDATGKIVTPGLIDAFTQLGVREVSMVSETNDSRANGTDQIAAAFRIWDGLNANSTLFAPARNEGVTNVIVAPNGGLIAGQAAMIELAGTRASELVTRAPVTMVAQIGDASGAGTGARGELIGKLRALLDDARYYKAHRADYDRRAARVMSAPRADLDALLPVLDGTLPLTVVADRADDIDAAFAIARDYSIKLIIASGAEAWMRATALAAAKVPVLAGAMNNIPNSFAMLNARQDNLALLVRAGVPCAIIGNGGSADEDQFNVRNIKYEAGNAVAYGLTHDEALRAVTLTPAELFGVADRIGSLQPGRDANVVIWSGDPFEFSTRVEHVFIRGHETLAKSRQDLLTEKYRTLPLR